MSKYIVTLDDLGAIARRVGTRVVMAPSSHRGKIGEMGTVVGVTGHWTGTSINARPGADYPDFEVVKEGRPGLWNSLSAWGIGFFTTIYVFSEDLSYHAGQWLWRGITDGNGHFLGIEAAGNGAWTEFQRKVYPRLVASALLFIDAGVEWFATHEGGAMPRGRKQDFPDDGDIWGPDLPGGPRNFRDTVSWLMANPNYINVNYRKPTPAKPAPSEDFMATLSDTEKRQLLGDIAAIRKGVEQLARKMPTIDTPTASADVVQYARWTNEHGRNANKKLDELTATLEQLADAVAAQADVPVSGQQPA